MKFISLLLLIFFGYVNAAIDLSPPSELKKIIKKDTKILFYIHGKIIEDQGVNAESEIYGVYQYQEIISKFEEHGFVVISEIREKDTDPEVYSTNIISQIKRLIEQGVSPENITVVGASKGSVISMLISSKLKNKDINFVLIANCNDWVKENFEIDLYGNILSIYESSDKIGQSCDPIFYTSKGLNKTNELKLDLGIGHGLVYKALNEWMIPTVEWAKNE